MMEVAAVTLRPVDLQVIIQKTSEVMKNRYQEDSKTRLQLQQQAQQLQQKERIENRQVKSAQKTERNAVHSKKEKDDGRKNQGHDKNRKEKQKETKGGRASTIDIKI